MIATKLILPARESSRYLSCGCSVWSVYANQLMNWPAVDSSQFANLVLFSILETTNKIEIKRAKNDEFEKSPSWLSCKSAIAPHAYKTVAGKLPKRKRLRCRLFDQNASIDRLRGVPHLLGMNASSTREATKPALSGAWFSRLVYGAPIVYGV